MDPQRRVCGTKAPMRFVVATHGHCFDGLASAVVFTRLISKLRPNATFCYRACGYGKDHLVPDDSVLTGDENAILDYRFFPSERLSWYFDHHATAFMKPEDRGYFDARSDNGRFFFEPTCTSCTKLLERVATESFGVPLSDLASLIRWADIIDSAGFESPEQALDRKNPALRLAAVVERYGDDAFLETFVPRLLERPLDEVASSSDVTKKYETLAKRHERFVERVRTRAEKRGRVVYVDLTDEPLETIGKFVTYALSPESMYSVLIGVVKTSVKISVGYNPWCGVPRDRDLGAICARYGGGGHPYVGALQLDRKDLTRAKVIASVITEELAE